MLLRLLCENAKQIQNNQQPSKNINDEAMGNLQKVN